MKRSKWLLPCLVLSACCVMGLVDGVIRPGYWAKSAVKLCLFLLLPLVYSRFDRSCDLRALFRPTKKGLRLSLLAGAGVYAVILCGYVLLKDVFDFSGLTASLTATTGVTKENFPFVALYISFVNSLLEEFFFRGFAFQTLSRTTGRSFAWGFSCAAFSCYHAAMMVGWFDWYVLVLALAGLFVGGGIFNWFDELDGTIYPSWLVHMCANFATNTVGFLLFLE